MSVINKKPLIEKVVSALSPEQKKNLLKGLNGELTKSVKVFDNLSTSDKGISYVDIKFTDGVKTGYLVYNDAVSVLIAYYSDTQKMTLFVLDVPKHTYKASREYLTIDELRRIVGLELVEIGENIKVQVGDIDSGSQASNKIIVSDGEGGASWGSVIDVIENSGVQDGSAQYLIGIDSNGDVVKDEIPEGIVVDQTIVEDSTNAVSGGAVYDALELKANSSDVYTKAAADELLDGKASISALENGTIVPAKSLVTEQLENVSEDSGTTQDAPFVFQATATDGGAGASDTAPIAKYLKLKGRTYAGNQLNNNANLTSGTEVNGITFTKNNDGSITIGGIATANINQNLKTAMGIQGHYYLMKGVKGGSSSTYWLRNDNMSGEQYRDYGQGVIFQWNNSFTWTLQIHIESGADFTTPITIYPQLFDLTRLFNGNDNIPTAILNGVTLSDYGLSFSGVDIFNQLFPLPYYAHNEGTLVSANATLLTTIGKNQFDGVLESGYIDTSGTNQSNNNRVRSKNFIKVVPAQIYSLLESSQFTFQDSYSILFCEYDENKNIITRKAGTHIANRSSKITLSNNTHYIRFYIIYTTDVHSQLENIKVDVSIYWDGSRTGFEEYIKHEYQLGDELKDNPLLSAGSVCDEKTPDGVITRRIGVVNLGTLDWYYVSSATRFYSTGIASLVKKQTSQTTKPNISISSKYDVIRNYDIYTESLDKVVSIDSDGNILLRDTAYTGGVALKTALSGVYLYYELTTPTTTQGTPFPAIAEVDDMGTMGYGGTSYNGYPQGCEFFYPADYVLFIDSLGNTCDFDASKIALKSDVSTEETARTNYDTILQNAIGGTLRQCLCVKETLDFDNTAVVDLGSLSWNVDSVGRMGSTTIDDLKNPDSASDLAKVLCTKYNNKTANQTYTQQKGVSIQSQKILIYDSSYNDADAFKNAMKGVLLAYEKASS